MAFSVDKYEQTTTNKLTGEVVSSTLTKTSKIKPRFFTMLFHDNIAMLNGVMNQEGQFFAQFLAHMDKDMILNINASVKRDFIKSMGVSAKNPINRAGVLINALVKKDLIRRISSGRYMANPDIVGKNANWKKINEKKHEYQQITLTFNSDKNTSDVEIKSWSDKELR